MVRRQDLTNDLAMRLDWVVASNLRAEILASYDIHPTALDDALEGAVMEMAAENRDSGSNLEKTAAELARSMAREHPLNAAVLIKTLRQGQDRKSTRLNSSH